jgi:uncharacterized Ntn-hydrolase superfamily protein
MSGEPTDPAGAEGGRAASRVRPCSTYSIVALDSAGGHMGAAVQSHWFSVGSVVPWAEPGSGVVATQAFANVSFGPLGLQLLREGSGAEQALQRLVEGDSGRERRQLAVLGSSGGVAAYTGSECLPVAGHRCGAGYSVQGNILSGDAVLPAMSAAFEGAGGPLAERMLAALEAAEEAGGELRGRQSASLQVVRVAATGKPWEDRLIDLRVEDHPEPLAELRRLLRLFRAYEHMERAEQAMERKDLATARQQYEQARKLCPDGEELLFWEAVVLAGSGRLEEARPLFRRAFRRQEGFREMARRLHAAGQLAVSDAELSGLLEEGR